jgi:zinc-finger of a C2HC-type
MMVTCELCGKGFGKSSIGIHMKACVAKREKSTSFCPVCDNLVSNDDFEKHVAECKIVNADLLKKKKAAAKKPGTVEAGAAGAAPAARSKVPEHILKKMREMQLSPEQRVLNKLGSPCDACGAAVANVACIGCHAVYCEGCSAGIHEANKALSDHAPTVRNDLAESNAAANAAALLAASNGAGGEDGRVACSVCDRKFGADRIAKHQLICQKVSSHGSKDDRLVCLCAACCRHLVIFLLLFTDCQQEER